MVSDNHEPSAGKANGSGPAPRIQISEKYLHAAFWSLAGILTLVAAWELVRSREQILDEARHTISNYTTVTESALEATLNRIDSSLHYWAIELGEHPERMISGAESVLKGHKEVLADIPGLEIHVLSPDGQFLTALSKNSALDPRTNFTENDWFKVIKYVQDPGAVLTAPFQAPGAPDRYIALLARRISSSTGALLGVIIASIEASSFGRVRGELNLGANGSFMVASGNALHFLDHYPPVPGMIGSLVGQYATTAKRNEGPDIFIDRSHVDGIERLYATDWINSYRVFVAIGMDMSSIMEPWRKQFISYFVGLCAIISAGATLLMRHRQYLRKIAENQQALANERFRLRQIIDNAPAVLYTCRPDSNLVATFMSPGIEVLGHKSEDFTGNAGFWIEHIHPDDQERVIKSQSRISATETLHREYRFRRADGIYHWLRDQVSVIVDSAGNTTALIGFLQDVNHEVATRERFELLYEAVNRTAIISTMESKGRITHANDRFCEISGYTREDLLGQTHEIMDSAYHDTAFFRDLWAAVERNQIWRGEIRHKRKDGSFYWVDSTVAPYFTGTAGSDSFISISFEVTQQKELQDLLMTSAKLSALGEMAGGVAHEINNPIAIIISKCRMLQRRIDAGVTDKEILLNELKKIEATGNRIARIVKGLRTFARNGESDPFELADLDQIVADTVELCAERFKHHSVELRLGTIPQVKIECQPVEISQIILNLLNNAHDAIESLDEKWIEISTSIKDDNVAIIITDSGGGISAEIATKIMQPFFTTKSVGRGTGLGLSVSSGIAKNHRGELYYDSNSSNTRFVLKLPLVQTQGLKKAI